MSIKFLKLPILITICLVLSTLTMGLPGGSRTPSPREDDDPVDVDELRKEFSTALPESVYQTFHIGYLYQISGDIKAAQFAYSKLQHIHRKSGGEFDLSTISKALRHNLRLLSRH
jgi:ssDNA-specific exonuclease RecJ